MCVPSVPRHLNHSFDHAVHYLEEKGEKGAPWRSNRRDLSAACSSRGQQVEEGWNRRLNTVDGSKPHRKDHIRVENRRGDAGHSPDIPSDDARLHQRTVRRIATGERRCPAAGHQRNGASLLALPPYRRATISDRRSARPWSAAGTR